MEGTVKHSPDGFWYTEEHAESMRKFDEMMHSRFMQMMEDAINEDRFLAGEFFEDHREWEEI